MTSELSRRIGFTLGALLAYRLGTYIPLPGIDPAAWEQIYRAQAGGTLGLINMLSGGGIHRMAILALSILPYVSAAVIIQLISIVSPALGQLKKDGARGRKVIARYTVSLTVLLAVFQSYGVATGLEGAGNVVSDPGWLFRLSTTVTLTGGTMVLVLLSELITVRGIGNGVSLLLAVGIVVELPMALVTMFELGRQGVLSGNAILGVFALAIAGTGFVVMMERAQRQVPIEFPRRQAGPRMIGGRSHLSVKLNSAGMIPANLAAGILLVPVTTIASFGGGRGPDGWSAFAGQLAHGRPLFMILYAGMILFLAFLYTAFVFNPTEAAETLRKHGGLIAGVGPGEGTAEYIDYVLSRITCIGAVYLVLVFLLPELLVAYTVLPFYFGGASLLIVVCTMVDLIAEVQGYRLLERGG